MDDNNVFDFSNLDFTISPSTITVTAPDGGEQWRLGSTQAITWIDNISEDVKMNFTREEFLILL